MIRRVGPLLALAAVVLIIAVGATYYTRLEQQYRNTPAKPKPLPPGTASAAQDWSYTQMNGSKPSVFVRAKDFKEQEGKFHLTGVELHIFHKDGSQYDQVQSAAADFEMSTGVMYSDGDVAITMGIPADSQPNGRLLAIKSSGVHFETKNGKVYTDRSASFTFAKGEGKSVGAEYDPNAHILHMKSAAELIWRGEDPHTTPMKIEAGDVLYKEQESKVYLSPWSRLTRGGMVLNAGPAVVTLDKSRLQHADTQNATGTDHEPNRDLDYAADQLSVDFDAGGEIQKMTGTNHARLVERSASGVTTITTDRIEMMFDTASGTSELQTAIASGHGIVESKPGAPGKAAANASAPETRILRSDTINVHMRAGGQEIESVETGGPGTVEFVPVGAGQQHRVMTGQFLSMKYGSQNQLESLRAVGVTTRSDRPRPSGAKADPPPALTWSRDLLARFKPGTSQLDTLEQWNDFRYQEGDRHATADRAVLNQTNNAIDLKTGARVWDPTGSTDADHILLDQQSGDFLADGHVNTLRVPEKKGGDAASSLLTQDEPLHGTARRVTSKDSNTKIHYEGSVLLWQGADRLEADTVDIDRDDEKLHAHGQVVTQLMDKPDKKDPKAAQKPPVFTVVHAPELIYTDDDKIAHYLGGAMLDRGPMRVKAHEIRAFMRASDDKKQPSADSGSSLDHAFADGQVEIVQASPDRTRTGRSDHAEYYVDADKVILTGGRPELVDTVKGTTRGDKLTWYAKQDRLVVTGSKGRLAQSNLRRK